MNTYNGYQVIDEELVDMEDDIDEDDESHLTSVKCWYDDGTGFVKECDNSSGDEEEGKNEQDVSCPNDRFLTIYIKAYKNIIKQLKKIGKDIQRHDNDTRFTDKQDHNIYDCTVQFQKNTSDLCKYCENMYFNLNLSKQKLMDERLMACCAYIKQYLFKNLHRFYDKSFITELHDIFVTCINRTEIKIIQKMCKTRSSCNLKSFCQT
jgi:hypothetical protein